MRSILLSFLLLLVPFLPAVETVQGRLSKANPGDFIVIQQGTQYALLLLRRIEGDTITIEEVCIEQNQIDLKTTSWKGWIESRAPGCSSWTSLSMNLTKGTISSCFSHTKNRWLLIQDPPPFIRQLLSLPLATTRENERRRIGPPPGPGEIDRRRFWQPQMMRQGRVIAQPRYSVLRGKWPDDGTRLAGCIVELYLDAENPSFAFPYWVEVQSPIYTFKVRAIDSGTDLTSPVPLVR